NVCRNLFFDVLFDEKETDAKDISNKLLQELEGGLLTDGQGSIGEFKNAVLLFTSNLGTRDISKAVGMGFSSTGEQDEAAQYERMKSKVDDELKKHFRPEFLNRIDDIVVFHQLTREQIVQMVDLLMGRVRRALEDKD